MTTFSSSSATAVLGVSFVDKTCARARMIFRETIKHDVGLDGFIELVEDGRATGILAGVQVKSGESYVNNSGTIFHFVADQDHFAYWGRCAFPVIGVVYDPLRDIALWIDISATLTDERIKNGPFTITVKRAPGTEFNKDTLLDTIQQIIRSRSTPRRTLADIRNLLADVAPSRLTQGPMRKDVLVRHIGGFIDAYYVIVRFDPAKGETFDDAREELRREARERPNLLQASIRRTNEPGHPWVCSWRRQTVGDAWSFEWMYGAEDETAPPLVLV